MSNSDFIKKFKPFIQQKWEAVGFEQATPVQEKTVPLMLEGKDLMVESPTGTGKTLAYALPLLHNIDSDIKHIQALILVPTRELVMQIHQEIQRFSEGSELQSVSLIGGADIKRQIEKLKKHPHIAVGTPRRIAELIQLKKLKMHEVKTIIFDEIDQTMTNEGTKTLEEIIKKTLRERQMLFFSATLPVETVRFGEEIMRNPEVVRITRAEAPQDHVEHIYFVSDKRDKVDTLRKIIRQDGVKALVFIQSNPVVDHVAAKLEHLGMSFDVLYGDDHKTARETAIKHFKENKVQVLLVSDLGGRGLDFEGITHVIHYDLPREEGQYIHRSGRTGRMGATGTVVSIVTNSEVKTLKKMTKNLKIPISAKRFYKGNIVNSVD